MKKPTLKERFQYWFDIEMSKGMVSLIRLLTDFTILAIALITVIGVIIGGAEDGHLGSLVWDSVATIINACVPNYDDGSTAYIFLMAVAALVGLLVTSVLIGIISTAIEEKFSNLKHGNSTVLESDHYVILGIIPGDFTLIKQLINAASGNPRCIVIADNIPRDELETMVRDNLEIPKNIRIICRTADIFDPASLRKCSLDTCKTIIISPMEDDRTVKALLAVSMIINKSDNEKVRVGALVSKDKYRLPESIAEKHNVTTLQTNDVIARIIAHSCTQSGLSETFREVLNFEGCELYISAFDEIIGKSFAYAIEAMDDAVPVGYVRNGVPVLNPPHNEIITGDDRLIFFAEDGFKGKFIISESENISVAFEKHTVTYPTGNIVVLGYNETFKTFIYELPMNTTDITVAGISSEFTDAIHIADSFRKDFHINIFEGDISDQAVFLSLVESADHVVLLSNHEIDSEEADMETIFRVLNLRDIRIRHNLNFNITAEMRKKCNQRLIDGDNRIDYIVASNLSALILAQVAENPELSPVFNELLTNEGNELYLKKAKSLNCAGEHTVQTLRKIVYSLGYVMLGYNKDDSGESVFNPPLLETITLSEDDNLIVIGEE